MAKPDLTPSERELMSVIWELGKKTTVREVLEHQYPNGEKAYTTVQTIMNKIVTKGFLKREKIGLVNFYSPTISQLSTIKKETKNFVKQAFDGSFLSLANYLIQSGSLSQNELKELKKIISENEKVNK
jgi:BlaI family penicillinase repressor